MAIGGSEVPAGMFQATNPIFILMFGLVFTALWGVLGKRDREPSTPTKFVMGLVQLGRASGCSGTAPSTPTGGVWWA
jgi:POT family proton-dependent oligopeptide transporter